MYDRDNKNCQIHHDMPLNCQAYPLGYNGEKYFVTDKACQGLGEGDINKIAVSEIRPYFFTIVFCHKGFNLINILAH